MASLKGTNKQLRAARDELTEELSSLQRSTRVTKVHQYSSLGISGSLDTATVVSPTVGISLFSGIGWAGGGGDCPCSVQWEWVNHGCFVTVHGIIQQMP